MYVKARESFKTAGMQFRRADEEGEDQEDKKRMQDEAQEYSDRQQEERQK